VVIIVGGGVAYLLRTPEKSNPAVATESRAPLTVQVAPVAMRDAQDFQQFAGSVQSRLTVQISARIIAHILELKVHSGQNVKKDDVLVRLDDADVISRIKQAEAGVGAAEAAVRSAEAALASAKASKVEADQDLKRFQDLYKAGAAPQQSLQQAEAKNKTAQANVDRAQEGISEAQKQVARAQAAVQEAKANLEYTVIRSPMDAVVIDKQAETGDLAAPGRSLISLQSPTQLWFEAPVSESCARRIALRDRVTVQVDAIQLSLPAAVDEIVPSVDPKSRSFLVRANLPSMPGLQPGLFGRLQFPCAARAALSVPKAALASRGQLDFVFVVAPDYGAPLPREGEGLGVRGKSLTAHLRLITCGREQNGWLEVLSGLSPEENVVVSPPPTLRDGDPVAIETPPEARK
jgi:RND family efflux transporter MFP subunit